MQPWDGFWLEVLSEAQSPVWLLPLLDAPDDPVVDPGGNVSPAERDASRLLTQATFGPTDRAIEEVMELGGPAAWIDAQMALPPRFHLPIVKQQFPDMQDRQAGRYSAFWTRALRSPDQLRQRVAFALSEIMVISERDGSLRANGNMVAAYYDVLLTHAFGNYRDLLEAVTLNPAMGIYLSMLGNDKPDNETGRRADENYARESMQLFSIGLVELNNNGTERSGAEPTFTQDDVENLARAFTGWSWDVPTWKPSPRSGWRPNRNTMERPMKAFAEHHDTDVKSFLGTTLPAGQTAAEDLTTALDVIFNHRNVGPFMAKQLIKRLVTSNPSPAYVQRVASAFNNNGSGVRGDMAAVVRAILLDEEARGVAASLRTDFGKLREPLLRLSHVWRAFRMPDPVNMPSGIVNRITQPAPLTAPSVFNFFSPSYSPPGAITSANLVAPEFQINSESKVNEANNMLLRVVQQNMFLNIFPTNLNLAKETRLLARPDELITHLDRLLLAGTMSPALRELLGEYIEMNTDEIDDARILLDVISLTVTSADFSVQR